MIIAGTGHRPDKLGGYSQEALRKLVVISQRYIDTLPEKPIILSGMALGWDQALAWAAINSGCEWWAYVPFKGQEMHWPEDSQAMYHLLLRNASHTVICSEGGYAAWKMQHRNKLMVDDSDCILAMFDGSPGGTANCIKYAELKKKPVVNLYNEFKII